MIVFELPALLVALVSCGAALFVGAVAVAWLRNAYRRYEARAFVRVYERVVRRFRADPLSPLTVEEFSRMVEAEGRRTFSDKLVRSNGRAVRRPATATHVD